MSTSFQLQDQYRVMHIPLLLTKQNFSLIDPWTSDEVEHGQLGYQSFLCLKIISKVWNRKIFRSLKFHTWYLPIYVQKTISKQNIGWG